MTFITNRTGNQLLLDIITDCELCFERGRTAATTTYKKARATLQEVIANRRARRAVVRLASLDDKVLRDIGVVRSDLDWALRLPLSVNSEEALVERVRRAGRRQ